MGSYPYPPNGLVEIDYEFILIFKKPGPGKKVLKEIKEASRLTKAEWKEYFAGHWHFGGARQLGHEAMFPEELPRRLIRMFTFVGDTVLDPFLGSGTTVKTALELGRNAVGYEINDSFEENIKEKIGLAGTQPLFTDIQLIKQKNKSIYLQDLEYVPLIQDSKPIPSPNVLDEKPQKFFKVVGIQDEKTVLLDDGKLVRFLGVQIKNKDASKKYLYDYILGKDVILKDLADSEDNGIVSGYMFLKNKIFVNAYLIKSGLALPDNRVTHRHADKFHQLGQEADRHPHTASH